eukprot:753320-Hanusia_phi.AAC.2
MGAPAAGRQGERWQGGKERREGKRGWMKHIGIVLFVCLSCCMVTAVDGFVVAGSRNLLRTHSSALCSRATGRGVARQGSLSLRCNAERNLYVFDFDGVLCNTVSNSVETAILAARHLWPETMQECNYLSARDAGVRKSWVGYDWSQYEADEGNEVPRWLEEKLKQLRPVATDPADLVLAARLCVSEAVTAKRSPSGERPLSAGEMVENWDFMRDVLLHKYKCKRNDLLDIFSAHEAAGKDDIAHWMRNNPLYPGIDETLRGCADELYILTTNEQDFTNMVLQRSGVELEPSRVLKASQHSKVLACLSIARLDAFVQAQILTELAKGNPGTLVLVPI